MKFVHPVDRDVPSLTSPRGGTSRRPQWLQEWIANKSKFALLSCGHKDDLNGAVVIFSAFEKSEVLCSKCDAFVGVERSLTLLEYLGIPKPHYSEIPLF
jgi:hypothetical protein